jgi:amidase
MKTMVREQLGAFCLHAGETQIPGREGGPLTGLTFAVKDLIDVAGLRTGGGNPDWLNDQTPAAEHAPAVAQLIEAGAKFVGKTNTDELAFSLTGRNVHYGTPINPRAPDRLPGGSSSGSASAVAAGVVDFALGTDTGGSVRVPASYCGIYGIRPTHNRVSLDRVVRFSPSFDTVGWFAEDPNVLEKVGENLLPDFHNHSLPTKIIRLDDAFERAEPATRLACDAFLERIGSFLAELHSIRVCPSDLDEWTQVFRTLRSVEVWKTKGPWIEQANPSFGPEIARNFAVAAQATEAEASNMRPAREKIVARLTDGMGENTLLALPTTPGPAPLRTCSYEELDRLRDRTQALTCIAGLGGLPQINIPAGSIDGAPVGFSLIAGRNRDEQLLSVAVLIAQHEARRQD